MKEYYLNLYTKTRDEYFDYLKSLLLREEKKFVITANTETFMLGIEDKEINDMLINPNNSIQDCTTGIKYIWITSCFYVKIRGENFLIFYEADFSIS